MVMELLNLINVMLQSVLILHMTDPIWKFTKKHIGKIKNMFVRYVTKYFLQVEDLKTIMSTIIDSHIIKRIHPNL